MLILGLLPFRQIIRSDYLYHLSLLEIVKFIIIIIFIINKLTESKSKLEIDYSYKTRKYIILVLISYVFSTIIGFVNQNVSEWNEVFRLSSTGVDYFIFFILIYEIIKTEKDLIIYLRIIFVLAIIATIYLPILILMPSLLPSTSEMGVLRSETVLGFPRLFTPSETLFFLLLIGMLGYILWGGKKIKTLPTSIYFFPSILTIALIPSFIRSDYLIILFWLIILILYKLLIKKKIIHLIQIALIFVIILIAGSFFHDNSGQSLVNALLYRIGSVEKIGSPNEENTVEARFMEVIIANQEITSSANVVFGLGFGHRFYWPFKPDPYYATQTHNGYYSTYYSQGIIGSILFFLFLIGITKNIFMNYKLSKNSKWENFQFSLFIIWISILIANLQAPVFQNYDQIPWVVGVIALSTKANDFYNKSLVYK